MISSIINIDINASGNRTGTTVRLGATVDYLDIAVSGISDFTKCVIHPLEAIQYSFTYAGSYDPPFCYQSGGTYNPGSYFWSDVYGGFYSPPSYSPNIICIGGSYSPGYTIYYDGVGLYIRLYGQFIGTKMGGSIELVNNSTLRVYFTGTLATTDRQVRGRLQIIQFK
jgi:hypothetical protein